MPSVYEQLQQYRAQNAKNLSTLLAKHPGVSAFSHPKTTEYFKEMMQRWQSAGNSPVISNVSGKE